MSSLNDGRLIDYDPHTGIADKYYEIDGQWYLDTQQDVEDIIEINKAEFNSVDERSRHQSETFNRVARLPLTVMADLERRGILQDQERFRAWLNDRDNLVFRTRPGKV